MLNWQSHFGEQLKGMELAKKLDDISPLILPAAHSSVWDGCARVLYEMPDDRLEKYLPLLLKWLQDYNWPGALIIRDRLIIFSGKKLKKPFITFVNNVLTENVSNGERLIWLDNLSELLDNKELKEELPVEMLEILQKHYNNPGWWYKE